MGCYAQSCQNSNIHIYRFYESSKHYQKRTSHSNVRFSIFAQQNVLELINQTIEKLCSFEISSESDGLVIIATIIEMVRWRRELDFMYDEQAYGISLNFLKRKEVKMLR